MTCSHRAVQLTMTGPEILRFAYWQSCITDAIAAT